MNVIKLIESGLCVDYVERLCNFCVLLPGKFGNVGRLLSRSRR
jgi:hypothetical protein